MKPFSLNIALAALAASLFLCCAEVPEELGEDPGNEACSGGAYYNSPGCPGYAGSPPSSSSLRQSSSSAPPPSSSSSLLPSSSSTAPSSSSTIPSSSSSSTPPSSSSAPPPSSSSVVPSSSSVLPSSSSRPSITYGSVTYGGQAYKTKQIGTQTWMAENLNYAVAGSKCGTASKTLTSDDTEYCNTYGRLYDWSTAMALPSSCNSNSCSGQVSAKHQGICPSGWHIPSNAEWDALYSYADGTSGTSSPYNSPTAGKHLKATSGWYNNGNGLDSYGFAALPGGGGSVGGFEDAGKDGYWWSSSEGNGIAAYNGSNAYVRNMVYDYEDALWNSIFKTFLLSVRCVKD